MGGRFHRWGTGALWVTRTPEVPKVSEYGKLELSTLLDFGASLSYATYLPCGPLVCTYEAQGSPRCQLTEKQACWQMLPGRRPGLREGCALGG